MVVRVPYRLFGHSARAFRSTSAEGAPSLQQQQQQQRRPTKQRSKYAQWYSDMLPPMIPIALLAATVYGVLEMYRSSLAHERQSVIQAARIADLEHELARLRASPGTGSAVAAAAAAAAGSDPVASTKKTAASSDAQAPTTQKGRWWALGWR